MDRGPFAGSLSPRSRAVPPRCALATIHSEGFAGELRKRSGDHDKKTVARRSCSALWCWRNCRLAGAERPRQRSRTRAPGYANSVFHHEARSTRSISTTASSPCRSRSGPSYPIGPKLRLQLSLDLQLPRRRLRHAAPRQSRRLRLQAARRKLRRSAIGWELTLGAIKHCRHGITRLGCYFGPGRQPAPVHTAPRATARSPETVRQFFLKGTGPYEMWDGDGNHYVFDKQVSGFDDAPGEATRTTSGAAATAGTWDRSPIHYGNGYTVTYWTGSTRSGPTAPRPATRPYDAADEDDAARGHRAAGCPRTSRCHRASTIHVNRGSTATSTAWCTRSTFPVFVNGAADDADLDSRLRRALRQLRALLRDRTWLREPPAASRSSSLPSDLPAPPKYRFTYSKGLLSKLTLPTRRHRSSTATAATIFFHGRAAAAVCRAARAFRRPRTACIVRFAQWPRSAAGSALESPSSPRPLPGDAPRTTRSAGWTLQTGVLKRTVTEPLRGRVSTTTYTQYSFPFGEAGSPGSPGEPQTLTVVFFLATDKNQPRQRRAAGALRPPSSASPKLLRRRPARRGRACPGDRVGADVEERFFETDPNVASPARPPAPGTRPTSRSARARRCGPSSAPSTTTTRRTWRATAVSQTETHDPRRGQLRDLPLPPGRLLQFRRRLGVQRPSLRQRDALRHARRRRPHDLHATGPRSNWSSGPPAGGAVLPNLFNERTSDRGLLGPRRALRVRRVDGFLKGSFVYDAVRDLAFLRLPLRRRGRQRRQGVLRRRFASASTPSQNVLLRQPSRPSRPRSAWTATCSGRTSRARTASC